MKHGEDGGNKSTEQGGCGYVGVPPIWNYELRITNFEWPGAAVSSADGDLGVLADALGPKLPKLTFEVTA